MNIGNSAKILPGTITTLLFQFSDKTLSLTCSDMDLPGIEHEQRVLSVHPLRRANDRLALHHFVPPHVSVSVPLILCKLFK